MLKSNTATSTNTCAKTAGREAASKAGQGLDHVKLAFAYGSVDYDLGAMLDGIAEGLPGVPVIGNTCYTGVITQEGFVGGGQGFLGVMALADDAMQVGVAISERGDCPVETGKKVAREAMKAAGKSGAPAYYYMVANPAEEEYYVKGITEVIGRVPFFGGSAADNTITGQWKLYTDQAVIADGVAVAFFYTDAPFANVYTGAYHETEDRGIVTKMNGDRTIAEIDGVSALRKYAAWRGLDPDGLKGGALLAASVVSPLGVKDRLGDLVAIRHPMNGNDDYTINVGNKVAVGTAVIRMEATVDELIASTGCTLEQLKTKIAAPIGALHLVHCGGRRAGIGDRIDEVAAQLQQAAGDIPFLTEFTFGEYGYEQDGCNTCGGLMLSFTALGK